MEVIKKKIAVISILLFSINFFCVIPFASAHSSEEVQYRSNHNMLTCCDQQKSKCHLMESSFGNGNPKVENMADLNTLNSSSSSFCVDSNQDGCLNKTNSFNKTLKEVSTVRLLL